MCVSKVCQHIESGWECSDLSGALQLCLSRDGVEGVYQWNQKCCSIGAGDYMSKDSPIYAINDPGA